MVSERRRRVQGPWGGGGGGQLSEDREEMTGGGDNGIMDRFLPCHQDPSARPNNPLVRMEIRFKDGERGVDVPVAQDGRRSCWFIPPGRQRQVGYVVRAESAPSGPPQQRHRVPAKVAGLMRRTKRLSRLDIFLRVEGHVNAEPPLWHHLFESYSRCIEWEGTHM